MLREPLQSKLVKYGSIVHRFTYIGHHHTETNISSASTYIRFSCCSGGFYPDPVACLISYFEEAMEHRNFPNSSRMVVDEGPDRNHLDAEQSHVDMGRIVPPENGLLYSMDDMLRRRVNCTPQWNSESRANEYTSSSFSTESPRFQPAFSGPSYGLLPQSSAAGNLHIVPESNTGHAHPNYFSRCNIHENDHGQRNSVAGSGRGSLKRKSPDFSAASEIGMTSRFYGAGSSSRSSESLQERPTFHHPNIPFGPNSLPTYRSGNLSIAGEGFSRNVRPRLDLGQEKPAFNHPDIAFGHNSLPHYGSGNLSIAGEDSLRNMRSRLNLGPNPIEPHLSSYPSHHYRPTTHPSNYQGAVDLANMNADGTTQQWNFNTPPFAPHGRIETSGSTSLDHESNQLLVRGSGRGIGGHSDSVSSGNLVSSSQYFQTPPVQGAREVRSSHSHRAIPTHRGGMSYSQLGHESASTENGLQSLSETYSSRYPRPSARGWRNSQSGRSRIAVERFQLISSVVDAHDRIGAEETMMMDYSPFYADSRNLFDQYRDMRLDIDDMGYEELLALGERIGDVSTGISEDAISKWVTKTMYSSDQSREEGSCAICLEEYASGDEVGNMKNCGHSYHESCIKKWLLMKNVCPICKAPAVKDLEQE